jgi:hypothetical protein
LLLSFLIWYPKLIFIITAIAWYFHFWLQQLTSVTNLSILYNMTVSISFFRFSAANMPCLIKLGNEWLFDEMMSVDVCYRSFIDVDSKIVTSTEKHGYLWELPSPRLGATQKVHNIDKSCPFLKFGSKRIVTLQFVTLTSRLHGGLK